MNSSDVAEVKELSEAEFMDHTDNAAISIPDFFPQCFPEIPGAIMVEKKTPSGLEGTVDSLHVSSKPMTAYVLDVVAGI